jgi:hypothetical protein
VTTYTTFSFMKLAKITLLGVRSFGKRTSEKPGKQARQANSYWAAHLPIPWTAPSCYSAVTHLT